MNPIRMICVLIAFSGAPALAQDDSDATIAELKARVATLEKRVEALEKLLAPLQADAQQRILRAEFEQRMVSDRKKYLAEQFAEIETMYAAMSKDWRNTEARRMLDQLTEKFPAANRTGCAMLSMAQVAEGEEKLRLLRGAIENHGDCLFEDGVQVGAYARYLLGLHYKANGQNTRAAQLFDELRQEFPYAIDHKGRSLETRIPKD